MAGISRTEQRIASAQTWLNSKTGVDMTTRIGKDGRLHIYATNGNDKIYVMGREDGRVMVKVNDQEMLLTREQAKKLTIHAGGGNDQVVIGSDVPPGVVVDGGRGRDRITNFNRGATIYGGKGNDKIENHGHGAHVRGGSGHDAILNAGRGARIEGNRGRDTIVNLGHGAEIYGGRGRDVIVQYGRLGAISGGRGSDVIVSGGYGNTIIDTSGNNLVVDSSGYNEVLSTGRTYRRGFFGLLERLFGLFGRAAAGGRQPPRSVERAYDRIEDRIETEAAWKEEAYRAEANQETIYD